MEHSVNATAYFIVSPGDDAHALAVQFQFNRMFAPHRSCLLLDMATFPLESSLSWFCQDGNINAELSLAPAWPKTFGKLAKLTDPADRKVFSFNDIGGVWYRRPRSVTIDPKVEAQEFREFATVVTRGLLESLFSACPTYNDVFYEERALMKPYQLYNAASIGFRIPRTLITSEPDRARSFISGLWNKGREVIYKDASGSQRTGTQTRLLSEADLDRLQDIAYCPITLQERISGGSDLRVVMVGDVVFVAEWRTRNGPTDHVDVRFDEGARMWPSRFPPSDLEKLKAFHRRAGLSFGVYDFKVDGNGSPVFLEVNPTGQWLDLELEAQLPISTAVARLLAYGPGSVEESDGIPLIQADLQEILTPYTNHSFPPGWIPQ